MKRLKRLTILIAVIGLLLAAAPVAPCEQPAAKDKKSEAGDVAHRRYPFAKGPLEAIDLGRHTVTVKTKEGVQTFTMNDRTAIFRAKDKITADKLKIGEVIALSFYESEQGRIFVRRIKVAPAKHQPNGNGPVTAE